MIHINQIGFLHEKLSQRYPSITYEKVRDLKLEEQKYKYLLALCYNNKRTELDSELFKLGVLN